VCACQLYSLYLSPPNFDAIAFPLYIAPSTTNTLVRITLSHHLRAAAEAELLKQSSRIDVEAIYQESEKADDEHFFREKKPGLFDASVFAYTNLLLDKGLDWKDTRMADGLRCHSNLLAHRTKIKKAYF
jgi:metaxin